eukprot:GHVU01067346.1.p1 GENE.GHVU01067346.1~~GHVU01067346.1.p1  ORF type:complete len:404 (-),score=31.16 GHVU01067346.1:502-1713(-)
MSGKRLRRKIRIVLLLRLRLLLALLVLTGENRAPPVLRVRDDFDVRRAGLLAENEFDQYHRMSPAAFEELLTHIAPSLSVDAVKSRNRTSTQPLEPACQLQMTLSYLSGGSYHHIRSIAGVSRSHFYSTVDNVLDAICSCDGLRLRFPSTEAGLHAAASDFHAISTRQVVYGCVAAIDGMLVETETPRKSDTSCPAAYYSGRYKKMGLCVQAACDAKCRFVAAAINSPGGCNDALAFTRWGFKEVIESLPAGLFAVGDAAYPLLPTLMVPYTGNHITRCQSNYNFAMSQLRIRIEMAFGLTVNKWRILKRPLRVKQRKAIKIIHGCMILHSFAVNAKLSGKTDAEASSWLRGHYDLAVQEAARDGTDVFMHTATAEFTRLCPAAETVRTAWRIVVLNAGLERP